MNKWCDKINIFCFNYLQDRYFAVLKFAKAKRLGGWLTVPYSESYMYRVGKKLLYYI